MTQVTQAPAKTRAQIASKTLRKDPWWRQPTVTATFLAIVVIYLTWASLVNKDYFWAPYISPLYSPCLATTCAKGSGFGWIPWLTALTPAIIIIGGPMGFRFTCYYYRKAYYRAYFLDPPACAVGEAGEHRYCGENALPLKLQNIHRYFMYLAVVVLAILWYDAIRAFFYEGQFGLGLGTVVMVANCVFLSFYTFGCHSLRHLIGGRLNTFHGGGCGHTCWKGVTKLNEHHQLWAWISLCTVGLTDLYIRLAASGVISDPNTWGILK